MTVEMQQTFIIANTLLQVLKQRYLFFSSSNRMCVAQPHFAKRQSDPGQK